jgi:YgiT-type zinc finger domain-containing protein
MKIECECGGTLRKVYVQKRHYRGGSFFYFERVEAEVCGKCGECYYSAETLHQLDLIADAQQATRVGKS